MEPDAPARLTRGVILLMAVVCGLTASTLYIAQPVIGLMAPDLGLPLAAGGLLVTAAQIGYAGSLLLLVPLGDVVENRALIVTMLGMTTIALALAGLTTSAGLFLMMTFGIGVTVSSAQMIVPLAAHWAAPAVRGRTIGTVVSGLLTGILLARPAASLIADAFGWRAIFEILAVVMAGTAVMAWRLFPRRVPDTGLSYRALIASLGPLLRRHALLRRRIAYQAPMFGAFTLFWTAIPLELTGPHFGLSQNGLALFALAGAAGAIAAPIAGRAADRGWVRGGTGLALLAVALGGLLSIAGVAGRSLALLVAAAIILDFGVQACLVLGQRAIQAIDADARSRLNALYVGCFFFGGAIGSALAPPLETGPGWTAVGAVTMVVALGALAFWATETAPRLVRHGATSHCRRIGAFTRKGYRLLPNRDGLGPSGLQNMIRISGAPFAQRRLALAVGMLAAATLAGCDTVTRVQPLGSGIAEVSAPDPSTQVNIASLSDVVQRNPSDPGAYNTRGVAYAKVGRYTEAIADFSAAVRLDPRNASALTNRALAYRETRRDDLARADFDGAIAASPNHVPAYIGRANLLRQQGDLQTALSDLDAAIRLNPEGAQAFHARGLIYQRQGQDARAITDFDNAIDRDPFVSAPYQARGQSLIAVGKYDKAIEDFNSALNVNNKNADAWAGLGLAYEKQGNMAKASESYSRAVSLDPGNAIGKQGQGRVGRA